VFVVHSFIFFGESLFLDIFLYISNTFSIHYTYISQAATKKQKYEKISEKKMSTPVEVLCKVSG